MRVCARVLAAALMTGAIAGAFALPSLVGQRVEEPRALPAPPSVKLRTLHLPVLKAPVEHTIAVHRHVAHHAARPALIAVRIPAPVKHVRQRTVVQAAASAGRSGLPSRSPAPSPAAPTPKPKPAAPAPTPVSPPPSAPPERALAETAQPATPAPPVAPPVKPGDDEDHGNGHAYGHSKHGDDDGQGEDKGNGQGDGKNGKGNGHKK